jgi:predicted metal-dependent enzyme (double-stranded beta helix superfamily)
LIKALNQVNDRASSAPPEESMNNEIKRSVADALDTIRSECNARNGQPDRGSLQVMQQALQNLAARGDLFTHEAFPLPEEGGRRASALYRLSEDEDGRFALYVNSARAGVDSPAHNHTTWAIIAGIRGCEENRFYERTDDGVNETGRFPVEAGTSVAFLPDDLHSIHIHEGAPVLNFHLYGLALEQLSERVFFKASAGTWERFPAHVDIREARS